MKVIIIEDEPLMSEALKEEILRVDARIEIVAQLSSIRESIAYLENNKWPDLFFSDIELSDGLSFEIFRHLQNTKPIVFCTAYDQYALEAFKVHGIDYILKPFQADDIDATLKKYKTLTNSTPSSLLDIESIVWW